MKLYSWNVNGIRAAQKKGFLDWLQTTQPDILGVQETKASPDQLDEALLKPEGYHTYWATSTVRKGYSGVALYTRKEPNDVKIGLGIEEYDQEGRTIIAEYDDFVFLTGYFPNGGAKNERVPFKLAYSDAFVQYCDDMRASGKRIIFCGDVNTSHNEIDIARPKDNAKKTGFMPIEREWMDKLVDEHGYVDTFRSLHPETVTYSYWSMRGGARERNVGWRLDYFFVSPDVMPNVESAEIHTDIMGSDHCPVSLTLK
jgi:exodeoxyribonuclease-3